MAPRQDTVILRQMRAALRAGEKLSDAQVMKLAQLNRANNVANHYVGISKLALREGEEVMDFVWTMVSAVETDRIILADGSLDAWLMGIFEDYVIVEDGNTGRLFRAEFSRNEKDEISFSEPVEVRQVFVPVKTSTDAEGEAVAAAVSKRATPAYDGFVDVSKRATGGKWGFLPATLRDRKG